MKLLFKYLFLYFTPALARVFKLQGDAGKDDRGVGEVESALGQRPVALDGVERDTHAVNVATTTV